MSLAVFLYTYLPTLLIKGTSIGTTTDFDGNFEITSEKIRNYLNKFNLASNDITLIISYIGYNTVEIENIKIKEWEEKFDREQKAKEHRENLREQRLKQKELEKLGAFEEKENDMSSALEKFNIDKTKEH